MSIYDDTIVEDLEDIFTDDDGFWREHDVNGAKIKAIVHAAALSTRSALLDLGTFGADCVCIVRKSDYKAGMPELDSIFFLDSVEYRVSAASRLGGLLVKISLRRVEG